MHPLADLENMGCVADRPEKIGDGLNESVTGILKCYPDAPSAPWRNLYWSAVGVRRAGLAHTALEGNEKISKCEEILMIVNVVIMRAHDGLGGGDGMQWCLSLAKYIDSPITIIEALLVLSNKILRSNQFGLHKSERYLYILARHWAKLMGQEDPIAVAKIVKQLKEVTSPQSEAFWAYLFERGRVGLLQSLIKIMEGHLPDNAQAIPLENLVHAVDVVVDDITINSIF
jgi:hypothetical protein